jgi:hypothetical protein
MQFSTLGQLQTALLHIDDLIRAAADRASAAGYAPTEQLRGLVITPEEFDQYLAQSPLENPLGDAALPPLPLEGPFARLASTFNLTEIDLLILLLALAPELDRRYERLYAFLQDDVSQRYPTVNLAMNLLGENPIGRFVVWNRLVPHSPLREHRLVECVAEPKGAPFLAQQLKVDYRVIAHLLGEAQPDERVRAAVRAGGHDATSALPDSALEPIFAALPTAPLVYLMGRRGLGQLETAAALCASADLPLVSIDLAALNGLETPFETAWRLALREGYFASAALFLDNWESALDENRAPRPAVWEALRAYPAPVFLHGVDDWEPPDGDRRMLRLTFDIPPYDERLRAWTEQTAKAGVSADAVDLDEMAGKFRLARGQIARAVHTAVDMAASEGAPVAQKHLRAGAQAHTALHIGSLVGRIAPRYTWDDLILPPDPITQLREISARMRYAHIVRDEWGFGGKAARSYGISALFAGESGTGKTLAAQVIANDLGLTLYRVDLSSVVSKYIGETEKNLGAIFNAAQASSAVLFFDEADALFGKRSEVKDARDRYANIEIAYLLQQIEVYDGIVVLATNLRQNLDEAFTRRLDFLIDFPFPDSQYRERIWRAHLPPAAPLGSDVNLAEVAERYRLAGGNIRNVAIAAAYLAAADGRVITLAHIRSAVRRENQKMGRLLNE